MQEALGTRQIAVIGERPHQLSPAVVIARHDKNRHGQRLDELPHFAIFIALAMIDQIAGDDHEIGHRYQPANTLHRRDE